MLVIFFVCVPFGCKTTLTWCNNETNIWQGFLSWNSITAIEIQISGDRLTGAREVISWYSNQHHHQSTYTMLGSAESPTRLIQLSSYQSELTLWWLQLELGDVPVSENHWKGSPSNTELPQHVPVSQTPISKVQQLVHTTNLKLFSAIRKKKKNNHKQPCRTDPKVNYMTNYMTNYMIRQH